jgi:hypothetical protein
MEIGLLQRNRLTELRMLGRLKEVSARLQLTLSVEINFKQSGGGSGGREMGHFRKDSI